MSGWRDTDGRTAAERRRVEGEQARARFGDTVRHRPLSLVKPALMIALAALIAWVLVSRYF